MNHFQKDHDDPNELIHDKEKVNVYENDDAYILYDDVDKDNLYSVDDNDDLQLQDIDNIDHQGNYEGELELDDIHYVNDPNHEGGNDINNINNGNHGNHQDNREHSNSNNQPNPNDNLNHLNNLNLNSDLNNNVNYMTHPDDSGRSKNAQPVDTNNTQGNNNQNTSNQGNANQKGIYIIILNLV